MSTVDTKYYNVADCVFSISATTDIIEQYLKNCSPFETKYLEDRIFDLEIYQSKSVFEYELFYTQIDEGQKIYCGNISDGRYSFEFEMLGVKTGILIVDSEFSLGRLYLYEKGHKFSCDNSEMIMFAISSLKKSVLLFHSSVVNYNGLAYMFLAKSGTGKSTHSKLWIENIQGTELLNDDNPAVRVSDKGVFVYGTPWSGKTPCYLNKKFPAGAMVQIVRATVNKITKFPGIKAYAVITSSVSGMRFINKFADMLHDIENEIVKRVKIYSLECLPDADAAFCCWNEVTK